MPLEFEMLILHRWPRRGWEERGWVWGA